MKTKIIILFSILTSLSVTVFSQSAWDGYRKKLTDENKFITFAAIYGVDGKVYSAPPNVKLPPEEAKAILNIFANPGKAVNTDLAINKVKYKVAKADKTYILGKAGNSWFEVMKTKQVMLVVVGTDPQIRETTQRLGSWLLQNGS
jgi:hypothetical protein